MSVLGECGPYASRSPVANVEDADSEVAAQLEALQALDGKALLPQLGWWASADTSADKFNEVLASRANKVDASRAAVEQVLSSLPPPSPGVTQDVHGWGIGNGVWRQLDVAGLMIEGWLDGNPGGPPKKISTGEWRMSSLDGMVNALEAVLQHARLQPLIAALDDDARSAVAKTIEVLRASAALHGGASAMTPWSEAWVSHAASELPVGGALVWTTRWCWKDDKRKQGHANQDTFVGVVLEKVSAPHPHGDPHGEEAAAAVEGEEASADVVGEARYRYTTCNGGGGFEPGLEWHDQVASVGEEQWKGTAKPLGVESFEVGSDALFDPYFCELMREMGSAPESWSSALAYYMGLSTVGAAYKTTPVRDGGDSDRGSPHDAVSPCQSRVASEPKCVVKAARYVLMRYGMNRTQYKQLRLAMRVALLEQVVADLGSCRPCHDAETEADLAVIDAFAGQVARHALKGQRAGRLGPPGMQAVLDTLYALSTQRRTLMEAYLPSVVQLPARMEALPDRSLAAAANIPDLRLLSQPRDRSPLAGKASTVSFNAPPPYLSVPHEPAANAERAHEIISLSADVAEKLMDDNGKYARAVVICEDAVFRLLPTPTAANASADGSGRDEPGDEPGCASWYGRVGGQERSKLLAAITRMSGLYVAASISIGADDPDPLMTKTRRMACMLSLFAIFDAVIRADTARQTVASGSLASVLNQGFLLAYMYDDDVDGGFFSKGDADGPSMAAGWAVANGLMREALLTDPHAARALTNAARYFHEQAVATKTLAKRRLFTFVQQGDPRVVEIRKHQPDEGMFDFFEKLLDALGMQLSIPPCLESMRQVGLLKDAQLAMQEGVDPWRPFPIDPAKLPHLVRVGGWMKENGPPPVRTEFTQLTTMATTMRFVSQLYTRDAQAALQMTGDIQMKSHDGTQMAKWEVTRALRTRLRPPHAAKVSWRRLPEPLCALTPECGGCTPSRRCRRASGTPTLAPARPSQATTSARSSSS